MSNADFIANVRARSAEQNLTPGAFAFSGVKAS